MGPNASYIIPATGRMHTIATASGSMISPVWNGVAPSDSCMNSGTYSNIANRPSDSATMSSNELVNCQTAKSRTSSSGSSASSSITTNTARLRTPKQIRIMTG